MTILLPLVAMFLTWQHLELREARRRLSAYEQSRSLSEWIALDMARHEAVIAEANVLVLGEARP